MLIKRKTRAEKAYAYRMPVSFKNLLILSTKKKKKKN